MSLLLALTGGAPTSLSATITWTQQGSTWSLTANSSQSQAISLTQDNAVWAVGSNSKASGVVAWTQDDSVFTVVLNGLDSSAISLTQTDQTWAIQATAGTVTTTADIAWTQDDATWLISANSPVTQERNSGGFFDYGENKTIHRDKAKQLERETKGIIARVNKGEDNQELLSDAEDVIAEIRKEIDALGIKAEYFERKNQENLALQAKVAQERLEEHIQEIDEVFAMMMFIAQI